MYIINITNTIATLDNLRQTVQCPNIPGENSHLQMVLACLNRKIDSNLYLLKCLLIYCDNYCYIILILIKFLLNFIINFHGDRSLYNFVGFTALHNPGFYSIQKYKLFKLQYL